MTCTCSAGLLSQSLFQLCLPATHPLERGRNRNPAPTPTIIYVYTNNFQEQNYLRALGRKHQKETQTPNKISTKNCLPRDALDYGKIWLAGSGHHLTGFLGTVCETAFFKHFFFHCIFRRMTTVWENPFTAGFGLSIWLLFREKLHGLLESLTGLLGENFDWNTFIFERGQDFQRNSGVKTRKTITVSRKKTPFLRKSIAPFRKIAHYLCQNPLLLLVKSAAVFWAKQPPLWGRRAGNGFFFGVEFCKIDQGHCSNNSRHVYWCWLDNSQLVWVFHVFPFKDQSQKKKH